MEKRISYDQFQSVKRVAQACNPLMVKRDKLKEKIEALTKEYCDYDTQIASLEAGIKSVIGFRVEELVKKVIEPGVDINGQPKKTTKYLPTDIVSYDAAKKQYVISLPEEEINILNPETNFLKGAKADASTEAASDAASEATSSDSVLSKVSASSEETASSESASSEESAPATEAYPIDDSCSHLFDNE